MLVKITILIFALVVFNFILLKFSSNKIAKETKVKKMPLVLKNETTTEQEPATLAPTGS
ncbi:hypothetical protein EV196_11092 [Mariniflexile fucanivorans]|uniref:Uncharacterized protein n=1 Tax=Mariniflexile fucanivorans TaxID=264023 RepID=A0A4R1RBR2_9FLAO|nr:hypothetical protein EV196_11092 [Mariniflexile fucanivorans]